MSTLRLLSRELIWRARDNKLTGQPGQSSKVIIEKNEGNRGLSRVPEAITIEKTEP